MTKLTDRERKELYESRLTWMDGKEAWYRYSIGDICAYTHGFQEQTSESGEPLIRVRVTVKEVYYCKEDLDRRLAWDAEKRLR